MRHHSYHSGWSCFLEKSFSWACYNRGFGVVSLKGSLPSLPSSLCGCLARSLASLCFGMVWLPPFRLTQCAYVCIIMVSVKVQGDHIVMKKNHPSNHWLQTGKKFVPPSYSGPLQKNSARVHGVSDSKLKVLLWKQYNDFELPKTSTLICRGNGPPANGTYPLNQQQNFFMGK